MRPLFFVGNKRSGTTLMCYLLNSHPKIYMGFEADILWYLYSGATCPFPYDDLGGFRRAYGRGMIEEMGIYRESKANVRDSDEIWRRFCRGLFHMMRVGCPGVYDSFPEKEVGMLEWLGDKKPAQCTFPLMRPWVEENFPAARYVHLVRHPQHCISSMSCLGRKGYRNDEEDFLGWSESVEKVTELWCMFEELALEIPDRIFLRYEDLCENPERIKNSLFTQLDLDPQEAGSMKRGQVMPSSYAWGYRHGKVDIPLTSNVKALMGEYGYLYEH